MSLMLMFLLEIQVSLAARQACVTQQTAVKFYAKCRNVCNINLLQSLSNDKLGGPDRIVELDEMHITSRKNNKGRPVVCDLWGFGGIERETRRAFVVAVRKRDRDTLTRCINHFVKEGTTFHTDGWRAYINLDLTFGGRHYWVNHKENFVSPDDPSVHTNTVERHWLQTRVELRSFQESVLESHLLMACCRSSFFYADFDAEKPNLKRKTTNAGELMSTMFKLIAAVYPGYGKVGITYPPKVELRPEAFPFSGKIESMIIKKPPNSDGGTAPATLSPIRPIRAPTARPNAALQAAVQRRRAAVAQRLPVMGPPTFLGLAAQLNLEATHFLDAMVQSRSWDTRRKITNALNANSGLPLGCVNLLRQAVPTTFNIFRHSAQKDKTTSDTFPKGVPEGMQVMVTCGGGDCFFGSISFSMFGSDTYVALVRLGVLWIVEKYFVFFDGLLPRQHINTQHGSSGAVDLLRATGCIGSKNHHNLMAYPSLIGNFHFAGSCTLVAASILLKAQIFIYQDLHLTPKNNNTGTLALLDNEFLRDRTVQPGARVYQASCVEMASATYTKVVRLNLRNQHYQAMLPAANLRPNQLRPSRINLSSIPVQQSDL